MSPETDPRTRILFVCARNSCRSPTAEAIARSVAGDVARFSSAGTQPRGRVDPMALHVLRRHGHVDNGLRSKGLTERAARAADRIILLTSDDDRPGPMPCPEKVEVWRVEDPLGWPVDIYEDVYADIETRVLRLAASLRRRIVEHEDSGLSVAA